MMSLNMEMLFIQNRSNLVTNSPRLSTADTFRVKLSSSIDRKEIEGPRFFTDLKIVSGALKSRFARIVLSFPRADIFNCSVRRGSFFPGWALRLFRLNVFIFQRRRKALFQWENCRGRNASLVCRFRKHTPSVIEWCFMGFGRSVRLFIFCLRSFFCYV